MAQIVAPSGLRTPQDVENALADIVRQMNTALETVQLAPFTVATLPRAKVPNIQIVVTDASTGRTVCLSDGEDWIDLQTGAPVV